MPPNSPAPRELTKKEVDAAVRKAFSLERRIKEAFLRTSKGWWDLAEALYEFHEGGMWQALGYDTLEEFLAQPELGISRSQFFRMTKNWRDLVVVRQVPTSGLRELEPQKVSEVVPAIMRGDVKPEDALADAKELGARDLREKYRPENIRQHGQKPDGSTPLDASAEPVRKVCPTCGSYYTVDDNHKPVIESAAREVE